MTESLHPKPYGSLVVGYAEVTHRYIGSIASSDVTCAASG